MTKRPDAAAQFETAMRNGRAAFAGSDFAGARQWFARALALTPHHVEALNGLGYALAALKRLPEALDCFRKVLLKQPGNVTAWFHAGSILALQHDAAAAEQHFARVLVLEPKHADALFYRGEALKSLGRFAEAADSFAAATVLAPDHAAAWQGRAAAAVRAGRRDEALECLKQVLRLQPGNPVARNNYVLALSAANRYTEALEVLHLAVEAEPESLSDRAALGYLYAALGRCEEALACLEGVLAANPDDTQTLLNYTATLCRMQRPEQALSLLQGALARQPGCADLHKGLGEVYGLMNRLDEALASLDEALRIEPAHARAADVRSMTLLRLGRLVEGFAAFEVRFKYPPLNKDVLVTAAPLWLGQAALEGKTLLLNREQGFGDSIQFARYARLAAERGARVILRLPDGLLSLLGTIRGVAEVVSETAPLPPHDLHCPMLSLPLAFGTTLESIPAGVPYISADPQGVDAWRVELGPARRMRVGLAWAGRQYPPINHERDMNLALLLPLLELDADWLSLQKEVPPADLALLQGLPQLRRAGEQVRDFADTAALIENLELVITVDSAVAHLAGALGKPVWLLNRYSGCWRWLQDRSDSPWYPSARIFRQTRFGRWQEVVEEVKAVLDQALAGSRPAGSESPVDRIGSIT